VLVTPAVAVIPKGAAVPRLGAAPAGPGPPPAPAGVPRIGSRLPHPAMKAARTAAINHIHALDPLPNVSIDLPFFEIRLTAKGAIFTAGIRRLLYGSAQIARGPLCPLTDTTKRPSRDGLLVLLSQPIAWWLTGAQLHPDCRSIGNYGSVEGRTHSTSSTVTASEHKTDKDQRHQPQQ